MDIVDISACITLSTPRPPGGQDTIRPQEHSWVSRARMTALITRISKGWAYFDSVSSQISGRKLWTKDSNQRFESTEDQTLNNFNWFDENIFNFIILILMIFVNKKINYPRWQSKEYENPILKNTFRKRLKAIFFGIIENNKKHKH